MKPLLEVRDLAVRLKTRNRNVQLVENASFSVEAGETYALVGESGCGKSITALSILRLLHEPSIHVNHGSIHFDGRDLLGLSDSQMREVRGKSIGAIFQDPMTSLNPVLTIGEQLVEGIRAHLGMSAQAAKREARQQLERVRIPDAERRMDDFPHRLSGGMRQRVMIAMAMACRPRLLIADEPTTALDVTVQAEILRLMHEMQRESGTALILITHNMGVVAQVADRVGVMYAGRIVEEGAAAALFAQPLHPYSRGLLSCVPELHLGDPGPQRQLPDIPGAVPDPAMRPAGCVFAPRCADAEPGCTQHRPTLEALANGQRVACIPVQRRMASPVALEGAAS